MSGYMDCDLFRSNFVKIFKRTFVQNGGLSLELYLSHVILIWSISLLYNSSLFGTSNVANFHKCLIIVFMISFFISKTVKIIEKKAFNI